MLLVVVDGLYPKYPRLEERLKVNILFDSDTYNIDHSYLISEDLYFFVVMNYHLVLIVVYD